jgi:hypothetical protein
METTDSNTMEMTTRRQSRTTKRRSGRSEGSRFPIDRPRHRASSRLVTRLFWA